jgi:hypothetical protein
MNLTFLDFDNNLVAKLILSNILIYFNSINNTT